MKLTLDYSVLLLIQVINIDKIILKPYIFYYFDIWYLNSYEIGTKYKLCYPIRNWTFWLPGWKTYEINLITVNREYAAVTCLGCSIRPNS